MDSNGWVAISNKKDQFHDNAVKLNKELLENGNRYVTSNFVLDEVYTVLLMRIGHFAAVDFGERIRQAQTVNIIHISADIEEKAWKIFKKYSDKEFSFTDCSSFAVMQGLNLKEAFTNDHHFEQMGFKILLR